ncbi:hypothetical protein [Feifania hominis]|uniref:DUF1540 domain-containing protein n=1 Tax=Feifania hominis TaxID=2763660 RepID=A0A926DD10_9FIRM|nr:hypothetical protein [Feifania hominis]MBC8535587.1 hypothetical protein [Feifania hominis]
MICCTKKCKYQKDGYCNLNTITSVNSASSDSDCIYFKPVDPAPTVPADREPNLPPRMENFY